MAESDTAERGLLAPEATPRRRKVGWRAALGAIASATAVALFLATISTGASTPAVARQKLKRAADDAGQPLMLSDLLKSDPAAAREAARITDPDVLPGTSAFAGYLTVDEAKRNHMYFMYFEPQSSPQPNERFPLVVWLQGGPGASSLFGLFAENGPVAIREDMTAEQRDIHWNKEFGLLYIDNPVGVGFSWSESESLSNSSRGDVADQLFSVLDQVYMLFPNLVDESELIISGESYAGHYSSGFAAKVMREVEAGSRIPFRGIALGNAWVDPVTQIPEYPDLLYYQSLVSDYERKIVQDYCDRTVAFIKEGDLKSAYAIFNELMFDPKDNVVLRLTGQRDHFSDIRNAEPASENFFETYLQQAWVRKAIHAGNRHYNQTSRKVGFPLQHDFMSSYRDEIDDLLQAGYEVLMYAGQLDIIVNPVLMRAWIQHLEWEGTSEFLDSSQQIWRNRTEPENVLGYVSSHGPLTVAIVRTAGHMVPSDQPAAALDLITRFVRKERFD